MQRKLSLDLERVRRDSEKNKSVPRAWWDELPLFDDRVERRAMELVEEKNESQRRCIGRLVASRPVPMLQAAGVRTIAIGRFGQATVQIPSSTVAKFQCLLEIRDGIPLLSNRNLYDAFKGTVAINGDLLCDDGWHALCDGDEFQVGPILFRIELQSDDHAAFRPRVKHQDS